MSPNKQNDVYRNCFSKSTLQPKIPDGKCVASVGLSMGATASVSLSGSKLEKTMIVVYPGLNSCVKILDKNNQFPVSLKQMKHVPHEIVDKAATFASTSNAIISNKSDWVKWRTVSAGVAITNIRANNVAQGWWQAISLPIPQDERWYTWNSDKKVTNVDYSQWEPSNYWFNCGGGCFCGTPTVHWPDNEYYQTGKIADLNQTVFQCVVDDHDHTFTDLDDHQRVNYYSDFGVGNIPNSDFNNAGSNKMVDPNGWGAAVVGDEVSETGMNAISKMWDRHHRVWLISFHIDNPTALADLLIESRNNQELVAGCGTALARFHSESASDSRDNPANTRAQHTRTPTTIADRAAEIGDRTINLFTNPESTLNRGIEVASEAARTVAAIANIRKNPGQAIEIVTKRRRRNPT